MVKTKVQELWGLLTPPAVEEDVTDPGTALYAPVYHLFLVRVVLAIVPMLLAFTTYERWAYRYPHAFSGIYMLESLCFAVLAAASLCVLLDTRVKIYGTLVELLYFTSAALSIAATITHTPYFPAVIMLFTHYALAPKIRVQKWFMIVPLLCHMPHTLHELFFAEFRDHPWVYSYALDLAGILLGGTLVVLFTEMLKHAEARQGAKLGAEERII